MNSTIAKKTFEEYKPNIEAYQKTHENLFVLGFQAAVIKCSSKRDITNNPTELPFCCNEECNNDAVWEIRFSNQLEDYTHSCECHLIEFIKPHKNVELNKLK